LNGEYPASFEDLDASGLFLFNTINPVTGELVNYGSNPETADDFNHLKIEPSAASWVITGQTPGYPDGNWTEYDWTIDTSEPWFDSMVELNSRNYPNYSAIKGYVLGEGLAKLLWDYVDRRGTFPGNSEQLLDGLWQLREDWPRNGILSNVQKEQFDQGEFNFGHSFSDKIIGAEWYDEAGNKYGVYWKWDPWSGTRNTMPTAGESPQNDITRINSNSVEFNPDTILWRCSVI
jgi:hypothetical protein